MSDEPEPVNNWDEPGATWDDPLVLFDEGRTQYPWVITGFAGRQPIWVRREDVRDREP